MPRHASSKMQPQVQLELITRAEASRTDEQTQCFEVRAAIYFQMRIEKHLLTYGNAFLLHQIEQAALNIMRHGVRDTDFYLTLADVQPAYVHKKDQFVAKEPSDDNTNDDAQKQAFAAIRGAITGALAGGHLQGEEGPSYAENVLRQIADLLNIELPVIPSHGEDVPARGNPDCEQCHGQGCGLCCDDIYYRQEDAAEQFRRDRSWDRNAGRD